MDWDHKNKEPKIMVVDSHVHFWNYDKVKDAWITDDMKVIQQHFLPEQIKKELQCNSIDAVVAVQADQSEMETFFLKQLAYDNSFIKGIVGWVDLQNENIEEQLHIFSKYPVIKGWRHIVQAEPDGFLTNENFLRGIGCLQKYQYTYDILVYPNQLNETLTFVNRFPNQKFVIDHCAKPTISKNEINEWKQLMKEFSQQSNVYCKLSGLITEAKWNEWKDVDFYPYLDVVFDSFGTSRVMFGSDWPVILLSGTYAMWKGVVKNYMKQFSEVEQKNVFGMNAIKFYNLS